MSTPTFEQIKAYERKRRALARKSQPETVKEVVEEPKAVEQGPDYSEMSRSDLFKLAKSKGYDHPWIASTSETLVEFLSNV